MKSTWLGLRHSRSARRPPPVSALMTRDPETARADEPLPVAAARMHAAKIRHLPVLDDDGMLVGMLSDRDVRSHHRSASTVGEAMTAEPYVTWTRAPMTEILDALITDRIGAIPVLAADRRLVGIVSYVDLLRWLRGDR